MLFTLQRRHFAVHTDLNVFVLGKANLRDDTHESESIALGRETEAVIREAVALEHKNFSSRP